jgi:MinD superfamily P-loop ATPase
MIIASTFNKGGVGKTTLAVHLIGVLNQKPTARNLLVDCVDQADAFTFFTPACKPYTVCADWESSRRVFQRISKW